MYQLNTLQLNKIYIIFHSLIRSYQEKLNVLAYMCNIKQYFYWSIRRYKNIEIAYAHTHLNCFNHPVY